MLNDPDASNGSGTLRLAQFLFVLTFFRVCIYKGRTLEAKVGHFVTREKQFLYYAESSLLISASSCRPT
jgi:hypothetical protein